MFCSKCGKELPDDSVFCNACGYEINAAPETKPAAEEKNVKVKKEKKPVNKKAVKTAVTISSAIFGVAAILYAVFLLILPSIAHSKAEELYNNNQYIEAYQAYIDAYRKPMHGNVQEDEITNCGFAVIDEFIKNGDAEGAFRFMHQYSKDSTMEGGWIINDTIYKLRDRRPAIVSDPSIQKKLCDSILQILNSDKYCRFDVNNINAYTNAPLFEHDILLLKYILLALPTDEESFALPHEICEKIIPLYVECANSDQFSDFSKQYLFTAEDAFQYVNIIMNSYLQNGDVPGLYKYFNEHPNMSEHLAEIIMWKGLADVSSEELQYKLYSGILTVLDSDQYFTFNYDDGTVEPWNLELIEYILNGLPDDYAYGQKNILHRFFMSGDEHGYRMHFYQNRDEVLMLWELDVIREMLTRCYDMIYILLDGKSYLYTEENGINYNVYIELDIEIKGSALSNVVYFDIVWKGISAPSKMPSSCSIEDNILVFYYSDATPPQNVWRFEFSEENFNEKIVYCFEDGKTITML